jgi:N-acetylneuraminate synthase/N,N'-diacetyllegionaminate synthase
MRKTFVIAEAGVNHNGEIRKAFELVDIAVAAKADAIKFQTFKPGECTGEFAVMVDYVRDACKNYKSRYDVAKKLALPYSDFVKIKKYSEKKKILFLTTPDGYESLEYVVGTLKVPMIKISSTEVTHLKFIEKVATKGMPIILSTGLSTLKEVEIAMNVIRKYHNNVMLLHCVSEYPTPDRNANIRAICALRDHFKCRVGYSDHTKGFEASLAAVAIGASIIEKHFTIDRNLPGPDHNFSLSPCQLVDFIKSIRKVELMLGTGIKKPTRGELRNINGIRRSVVASKGLRKGTLLKSEDIDFKRPGYGVHPYDYEKIIGFRLKKDMIKDEPIEWKHLER